jgi:hypothetical protein
VEVCPPDRAATRSIVDRVWWAMMKVPLKVKAAIVDRSLAGEPIEETADDFGLLVAEVQSIVDAVPIDLREMFANNSFALDDGTLYYCPFASKLSSKFFREYAAEISAISADDVSGMLRIADFLDAEND